MVPYSNSTHFEHTAFATRTFFTPRRNVCWRSYSEFDQSEDDDVGETHVGGVLSLGGIFGEMLVGEVLVGEMFVEEM